MASVYRHSTNLKTGHKSMVQVKTNMTPEDANRYAATLNTSEKIRDTKRLNGNIKGKSNLVQVFTVEDK